MKFSIMGANIQISYGITWDLKYVSPQAFPDKIVQNLNLGVSIMELWIKKKWTKYKP